MVPGRLGRVTEHVVATKLQCMYTHFRTNPVVTRTVADGICLLHLAGSSSSRGIGCCRCATIPPKNLFFPSLSPPPSCCCVKRYHFGPPVRKTMTAPIRGHTMMYRHTTLLAATSMFQVHARSCYIEISFPFFYFLVAYLTDAGQNANLSNLHHRRRYFLSMLLPI